MEDGQDSETSKAKNNRGLGSKFLRFYWTK